MSKFGDLLRGVAAPAPEPDTCCRRSSCPKPVVEKKHLLEEWIRRNLKSMVELKVLNSIDAIAKRL